MATTGKPQVIASRILFGIPAEIENGATDTCARASQSRTSGTRPVLPPRRFSATQGRWAPICGLRSEIWHRSLSTESAEKPFWREDRRLDIHIALQRPQEVSHKKPGRLCHEGRTGVGSGALVKSGSLTQFVGPQNNQRAKQSDAGWFRNGGGITSNGNIKIVDSYRSWPVNEIRFRVPGTAGVYRVSGTPCANILLTTLWAVLTACQRRVLLPSDPLAFGVTPA